MKSNSRNLLTGSFLTGSFLTGSLFAVLAAFTLSLSVMSCAPDNASGPSRVTAASILSADSTDNPNPCLVRAEWLADTLGLTAEQIAALTAAQDSLRAKAQAEIEAANGDRHLIKEALKKYRESMKAVVQTILTSDQLSLLESLRPPFHNKGPHRDNGRHRGHVKPAEHDSIMLVRLTAELGLTDEQVALVQALQEYIRSRHLRDPRGAFYEGMKTILTADQLAKFHEIVAREKGNNGRKVRRRGRR